MKHLKLFNSFNESYSKRDDFDPMAPVHLPHSDNVYGETNPGESNGSIDSEEYSNIVVPKLVGDNDKECIRWATYNAVSSALNYWDAISDEEWVEIDEEFKHRVINNPENPAPAIIKLLRRYDNLSDELLRLKKKIEGFIQEDKGFFTRLKERFKK